MLKAHLSMGPLTSAMFSVGLFQWESKRETAMLRSPFEHTTKCVFFDGPLGLVRETKRRPSPSLGSDPFESPGFLLPGRTGPTAGGLPDSGNPSFGGPRPGAFRVQMPKCTSSGMNQGRPNSDVHQFGCLLLKFVLTLTPKWLALQGVLNDSSLLGNGGSAFNRC